MNGQDAIALVDCALHFLPEKMNTPSAKAMLIAVALQESNMADRKQIGGPARGYWQFEKPGGVIGVLDHHATRAICIDIFKRFDLADLGPDMASVVYCMTAFNSVLAAGLARLLLWTHPDPLPDELEQARAWEYYLWCWRPGKPHPERWADNYSSAWRLFT